MGLPVVAYGGDQGFEGYTVLKKTTLNFLDAIANSNKYYTIELHEANGKFRIFTDYGRLGKTSKKEVRYPTSLFSAESEFDSIVRSKVKKGYKEVELAQSSTGSDRARELVDLSHVKTAAPAVKKSKSQLDPVIQSFVAQIFDEAGRKLNQLIRGSMTSDGSSPLGKLSPNQIEKGRRVLSELSAMIQRNQNITVNDVLTLTNEYYANIPKVFGSKISPNAIAIRTMDRVAEEMDVLKFYEDSLRMGGVIYDTSNIDKQYESLHSEIGLLDPHSDKYKAIVHYVNSTESHHHHVHLLVKRVYTVNQKNAPKFDGRCGNITELFHGSRSANLPGILSTYLKKPNNLGGNIVITGAMFGPGIYFASQSTKSSQYSNSRFGGTANKYPTAFMFLVDVALGKVHKVETSHYFIEPPRGFDSVQGVKGRSLLHDEFITYKENQQKIKYIVEFETRSR